MKKLALTLAIILGLGMSTFAQEEYVEQGLFGRGHEIFGDRDGEKVLPGLPDHGQDDDQNAPLGSGIALFMGLGAAYAVAKKRKD